MSEMEVEVMHANKKEARYHYNECLKQRLVESTQKTINEVHMIDIGDRLSIGDLDPQEEDKDCLELNEDLEASSN